MDDPWDVKSVRKSGQYISCMKLNGVPLLPPVLSKECRSEMQYYKLLAKEVEKRISNLQPFLESDTESAEDPTDAPEITECIQDYDSDNENTQVDTSHNTHKRIDDIDKETLEETISNSPHHTESYKYSCRHVNADSTPPNLIVDFSLDIKETVQENIGNNENSSLPELMEIPERDYNCIKPGDLLQDVEIKKLKCKQQKDTIIEEIVNFSFSIGRDPSLDSAIQESISQDSPPTLTSKSFTGSLNNIHTQSEALVKPLVRQHSYTILNPSPQLLAHLEVQSLNLGVDVSCISMSESLTNLSSPGKKRRSWDLESAKVKWSNMALELKQKNLSRLNNPRRNMAKGQAPRPVSPTRAKCVAAARTKYSTLSLKHTAKNEAPARPRASSPQRTRTSSPSRTRTASPMRNVPSNITMIFEEPMSFRTTKESKTNNVAKEPISPKNFNQKKGQQGETSETPKTSKTPNNKNLPQKTVTPHQQKNSEIKSPAKNNAANKSATPKQLSISESDDPAAKVRELYDKIQKQQLIQMSSLVEKQKREQLLLQQAFEEQNNLLFKQLKTICPKSPDKIKEAWADKTDKTDRGPVSLSQLISPKIPESPLPSTLTDSNKYLDYCNEILKKSKDISSTLKSNGKHQSQNGAKNPSKLHPDASRTRTNSPAGKNTPTSRKLNYDTSASSDRDFDPILTDRTNDTFADLNVTFPSDSEECRTSQAAHSPPCATEVTLIHRNTPIRSTDSAIKCMEQTIQRSINSCSTRARNRGNCQPTARQQAAASVIVAHAKGFLVRRLMRTARVQATVQTIKDALLCALQLHQDREGIRGADVDLHRRLIQQITAACYALHDTFITSTASERCAMIAADRSRRASLAARPPPKHRHSDIMSQSHSGAFPLRQKRFSAGPASLMTQSNYETCSSDVGRARYLPSPRRRPWR